MIARKHRFHGHNSLSFVYSKGKVLRGQYGMLKYCRNPRRDTYRAAVVVSKKVHKSAVVRNRIRRRLYEIVRLSAITANFDLVFIVHDEKVATLPADELSKLVREKLQKAGVI